ncbi:MAG: endopeptidase La [Planctomycetes bacterium]|nr:endopeptidase La [Planctomycetota bacterium]
MATKMIAPIVTVAPEPLTLPRELPLAYLVSQVVFPFGATPVRIRMDRNLALLDDLPQRDSVFAIAFAPSVAPEKVTKADLGRIAVAARVIARLKLPDGTEQVTVQGLQRLRIELILSETPYFTARVTPLVESPGEPAKNDAEILHILEMLEELSKLEPALQPEHLALLRANLGDPGHFADLVANVISLEPSAQVRILESADVGARLVHVGALVREQLEFARVVRETDLKVREDIEKSQRDYYLRRQMKVLKEQLGETTREEEAARAAEKRLAAIDAPPPVVAVAKKEIDRLRNTSSQSAEFAVIENYLDSLLSMPWSKMCPDTIDLPAVRRRLEADHFGLEQPKERILEYLAVRKLAPTARGPILCLVGPPGTGKTSLAQSIAKAMGRVLVSIAVGGVRDESEIRGHRRTYVGAMPGRIAAAMKKAGCSNPLMVIDEIDKMGEGPQGDPSAAMLEVLDPEQNSSFVDHYLDLPIDLSHVFFVCTANSLWDIPGPLRDRMEVIELSSYVEQEKVEIARRHLIRRCAEAAGIPRGIHISDDALRLLIRGYTMEAGVRELRRQIEAVYRKLALRRAEGRRVPRSIGATVVRNLLGPEPYVGERRRRKNEIGVVNGLAWTGLGGDVLLIEGIRMPGDGGVQVTGSIGDVMKESVQAAYSFVKSRFEALGLDPSEFKKWDIHLHFPEGAVPKDGPSAGTAVTTALASLFSGLPVRADIAMTGEVTLRGEVLPIGGLREKLAAAARLGMREVIVPRANEGDLHWVRKSVLDALKIHFVRHVDEVLQLALVLPGAPRRTKKRRKR